MKTPNIAAKTMTSSEYGGTNTISEKIKKTIIEITLAFEIT